MDIPRQRAQQPTPCMAGGKAQALIPCTPPTTIHSHGSLALRHKRLKHD